MKTIMMPASKSYTNRALLMAALAPHPVTLHHPLYCEDTEAMMECLRGLGVKIETYQEKIQISIPGLSPSAQSGLRFLPSLTKKFFVRDSGTALRFLLPLLCLTPEEKILKGSEALNRRPIKPLVNALRQLGAKIDYLEQEEFPPLKIFSSHLNAGEISLDAGISSQFLSALLMISPLLQGLCIRLEGKPISNSYVEMTISMMQDWGIRIVRENQTLMVPTHQSYQKSSYIIEGDYSAAGYFLGAAALSKISLRLENLNPHSLQGDKAFLDILEKMGNLIELKNQTVMIHGKGVKCANVNMENCPDQVQTLAVLAAFSEGPTVIHGVRSLRYKETDRIFALQTELAKMGIRVEVADDTLTIHGGNPKTAIIETYGDHRMAMAFAMASLVLPSLQIQDPQVVKKTFPDFWEKFKQLR